LNDQLELPQNDPSHTYNQFVIRVLETTRRDALQHYLKEHGIGTAVYYPKPLHLQPCFSHLGYKPGSLPQAELASQQCLALPIFPGLTTNEINYVVDTISKFYKNP